MIYLLILSCSKRKSKNSTPMPALERYDGVNYRVVKKLKRSGKSPINLDIVIISAKHGFLRPDDLIGYYDQVMTEERALKLRFDALNELEEFFKDKNYEEIFVNLGKTYLLAIDGFERFLPEKTKVVYAKGGIGQKMKEMKEWLVSKEKTKTRNKV